MSSVGMVGGGGLGGGSGPAITVRKIKRGRPGIKNKIKIAGGSAVPAEAYRLVKL